MQGKKTVISIFVSLALSQLFASNIALADDQLTGAAAQANHPLNISDVYSNVELNLKLAAKANLKACSADECIAQNQQFDARVQSLGMQLSEAAFFKNPNLKNRLKAFEFSVLDKKEIGITSNASGKVVVFRGLQQLDLSDEAMNFILAREMGHIIAKHHNKNITAKLVISALASVVFPALAIASASSAAAQASTATTLMTSAASTATSMVGSEVAIQKMKPGQLVEADEIALSLVESAVYETEWDLGVVAGSLQYDVENIAADQQSVWVKDLGKTALYLENKALSLAEAAFANKEEVAGFAY